MKIPCNFQVRSTGSCETIRMGLWRPPEAPQCLEALALQPSGRLSNTVRMLGLTPSSTQSWISVNIVWKVSEWRLYDMATRPNATQRSRIFWVSFTKAEMSDNEDRTLSQAVRTWSYYGKNCAILERRLQKTVRTRLTSVRTPTCQRSNLSKIRFFESL
jgi:hypothetical protein